MSEAALPTEARPGPTPLQALAPSCVSKHPESHGFDYQAARLLEDRRLRIGTIVLIRFDNLVMRNLQ